MVYIFDGLSVIVTIYNTEPYLLRCLNSIAKQTFKELEVILINDGSTDNSEKICSKFVDSDSRFRLINKPNGGVSSARNLGLVNARGRYIAFIDSDDYVAINMYQLLYNTMTTDNADMVQCSFCYDYGMKTKPVKIKKPLGTLSKKEYFIQIASDSFSFYNGVVWNKLFCKDIIMKQSIFFDESIHVMEDWKFILNYLKYAEKIVRLPDNLYFYNRYNHNSITQKKQLFELSYHNRMQGYYDLYEYSNSIGYYKQYKDLVSEYLLRYLISQKYKILLSDNKKEALELHKNITNRKEINDVIKSISKLTRVKRSIYYNIIYFIETFVEWLRIMKRKII